MAVARERKKVVVIGGGVGGSLVAKLLQFNADVVLIDQKEYFEIPWAALRSKVEPLVAERTVMLHSDYFTSGRIITSAAADVTEKGVVTAEGELVPYDYLVIATGHDGPFPKNRSERLAHYKAEYEKIVSADSVLIIGGGPTGVELAGEIAVDFPNKKVTLVHRGSRLLEFISSKASRKTLKWLTSKKLEVILNESVNLNSASNGSYVTSSGRVIKADIHFLCTGSPVGSSWLKDTSLKDKLDEGGRLMVDKHLRVKGHENIFAIGDITNVKEMKQGYVAQAHAALTAKNLSLLMAGNKKEKMGGYKPGPELAIVSLGRKQGVAQLPFGTCFGWLPGKMKSGDLFIGRTRKVLGIKDVV